MRNYGAEVHEQEVLKLDNFKGWDYE